MCGRVNHNRPEKEGVDGFPQPFSKSLLRNVLIEYALLLGKTLPSVALVEYKNHRKSFTLVYTLDVYIWQMNRSNWLYPSCDGSRWSKDSKALSMSSSEAINTSLALPANRPDMSNPV